MPPRISAALGMTYELDRGLRDHTNVFFKKVLPLGVGWSQRFKRGGESGGVVHTFFVPTVIVRADAKRTVHGRAIANGAQLARGRQTPA